MISLDQRGDFVGRDVVMVHGLPSAPESMWHIGDALVDIARVTNVSLPNYGKSDPLRPYDTRKALELVEQALIDAGIRRPILLGFSAGVYRAFELAMRPALAARAVIALSGFHDLSAAHREGLRGTASVARDHGSDLASLFTAYLLSPAGTRNAAFVAEVATWFTCSDRDDVARELDAFSLSPGLDLSALDVPVLARVGDLDLATPVALTDSLVAALSSTKAVKQIVSGAGHAIMLEDAAATAAAVREFVLALG